ncbi:MAG: hypothetical protein R3Y43_00880 [Alphaproteobacteria bacterium]
MHRINIHSIKQPQKHSKNKNTKKNKDKSSTAFVFIIFSTCGAKAKEVQVPAIYPRAFYEKIEYPCEEFCFLNLILFVKCSGLQFINKIKEQKTKDEQGDSIFS